MSGGYIDALLNAKNVDDVITILTKASIVDPVLWKATVHPLEKLFATTISTVDELLQICGDPRQYAVLVLCTCLTKDSRPAELCPEQLPTLQHSCNVYADQQYVCIEVVKSLFVDALRKFEART